MTISLIAAMSVGTQVIGNNGEIPWLLPGDLKHFKELTMGKPIIMGRKTHESIKRVLPGRTNIVITSQRKFYANGAAVVFSINSALDLAAATDPGKEIMIIGGGHLYKQTIDVADTIYATFVMGNYDGDAFFPPINGKEWIIKDYDFMPADSLNPSPHAFVKFIRRNKK